MIPRDARPVTDALRCCRQNGVAPTRHLLVVRVATQKLMRFELTRVGRSQGDPPGPRPKAGTFLPRPIGWGAGRGEGSIPRANPPAQGSILRNVYRCSTSKFGLGSVANSNCTPLGLHRIARKIGGGWPIGTVFKGRRTIGYTWDGLPLASITDRIFWLEGLEPGRNRGGNTDSFARYIYIHGTGDEPTLGRPASHGCVHLAAADLIPLHDQVPAGTLVWIAER